MLHRVYSIRVRITIDEALSPWLADEQYLCCIPIRMEKELHTLDNNGFLWSLLLVIPTIDARSNWLALSLGLIQLEMIHPTDRNSPVSISVCILFNKISPRSLSTIDIIVRYYEQYIDLLF